MPPNATLLFCECSLFLFLFPLQNVTSSVVHFCSLFPLLVSGDPEISLWFLTPTAVSVSLLVVISLLNGIALVFGFAQGVVRADRGASMWWAIVVLQGGSLLGKIGHTFALGNRSHHAASPSDGGMQTMALTVQQPARNNQDRDRPKHLSLWNAALLILLAVQHFLTGLFFCCLSFHILPLQPFSVTGGGLSIAAGIVAIAGFFIHLIDLKVPFVSLGGHGCALITVILTTIFAFVTLHGESGASICLELCVLLLNLMGFTLSFS